jgi:hypothetical protein
MTKSIRMRWEGHVARMVEKGNVIGFWWESKKERDLKEEVDVGEDNIKLDLSEIGWGGMDWIHLAQDRNQ